MSDRRTKITHKRRIFTVVRTADGVSITYKKLGEVRSLNPHSALADELREVKPEAFAPPKPGRKR